jgi:hypothetical protein
VDLPLEVAETLCTKQDVADQRPVVVEVAALDREVV